MGMYTEIIVKASIRSGISKVESAVLKFLFNGGDEPEELPDHQFFSKPRWRSIGRSSSYYHIPWTSSQFGPPDDLDYVFSRSDLKNYDNEIGAFFDWFAGLTDAVEGDCIGWSWYEEDRVPTLALVSGT